MLARVPWIPIERTATRPKPKTRRLNRDRRDHLLATTITILRHGEPSPFALESRCRQGLRALFCLDGWTWAAADATAAEIVQAALARIGAKRPTWQEGQPEWTQPGILAFGRTRCVRCGWRLPEGHYKFCGHLCADAHNQALNRLREAEEQRAYDLVARGAPWLETKCG